MRRALIPLISVLLCGCGIDPGARYFPAMMRSSELVPKEADPPPNIRALLKSNLSAFFLASSAPTQVSFSAPQLNRGEWTTCVRARVNGAMGTPIGQQTYLVNILHNQVSRQEHVESGHPCFSEKFEAI